MRFLVGDLKREVAATALVLLAIFIAGALLAQPAQPGICLSAHSSFGPVGSCVRWGLLGLTGPVSAALYVLIPLVFAAHFVGRLGHLQATQWAWFLVGAAAILCIAVALVHGVALEELHTDRLAGAVGTLSAYSLAHTVGFGGAWLVLALCLYVLSARTIARGRLRLPARSRQQFLVPRSEPRVESRAESRFEPRAESRALAPFPPRDLAVELTDDFATAVPVIAPPDWITGEVEEVVINDDDLPSPALLTQSAPPPPVAPETSREIDAMEFKILGALRAMELDGATISRRNGPTLTCYEIASTATANLAAKPHFAAELTRRLKGSNVRVVDTAASGRVVVEVPRGIREVVGIRELLESAEYRQATRALPIVLGRGGDGKAVVADLAKMPHLLIGGERGTGKSVCASAIIASLVYRHSPKTLRMFVIDGADGALSSYATLPHLLHPVVTGATGAAVVLARAMADMQVRYDLLTRHAARNIQEFNRRVRERALFGSTGRVEAALPHLVIVIDDLGSVAANGGPDARRSIATLVQRARTVGIHIVATVSGASIEEIGPAIRANFPSRVALRAADAAASRATIDMSGAESLMGDGDLLFVPPARSEAIRVQGAFLSDADVRRLTRWFAEPSARASMVEEASKLLDTILEGQRDAGAQASGARILGATRTAVP